MAHTRFWVTYYYLLATLLALLFWGPTTQAAALAGPYLVVIPYGGLTNQLWTVFKALAAAQKHGFQAVLPEWPIDPKEGGVADIMDFEYMYSSAKLIDHCKGLNISVVQQLPPELHQPCYMQLGSADSVRCPSPYEETILGWAKQHNVVCLTRTCSYRQILTGLSFHPNYELYRPGFVPSERFRFEVERVLDSLSAKYGTRSFVTVHVRTEPDFAKACQDEVVHTSLKGLACHASERQISDYLAPWVPNGTLLFVASGDHISGMPNLCSAYRCWTAQDVQPQMGADIIDKFTTRAFRDYLLCQRGAAFYGNAYSSFSRELHAYYSAVYKRPADYYNPRVTAEVRRRTLRLRHKMVERA